MNKVEVEVEEVSWLALLEPIADNLIALYAQQKDKKALSTVAIWPQLSRTYKQWELIRIQLKAAVFE